MITAHSQFETNHWQQGKKYVAGIDEVGRGCWAGPFVVGAVIFPQNVELPFKLADSKLLSEKKRETLAAKIKEYALSYAIAEISIEQLNSFGLAKAAQQAFAQAINTLSQAPDFVLMDAFTIKEYPRENQQPIIKGDQQSISIATASILAKVHRDTYMKQLHQQCQQYGFDEHKGYGTQSHRQALAKHGLSPHHRTCFNLSKWL